MSNAILKLESISLTKSYEDYEKNFNKSIVPSKSSKVKYFSGIFMSIVLIGIGIHAIINNYQLGILSATIMLIFLILSCSLSLSGSYELFFNDKKSKEKLTKKEFMIGEFKNKTLTLNEIKSINDSISLLKGGLMDSEFNEVLFETQKISEKEIGNAYFYYVLFTQYDEILNKIRNDKNEKNIMIEKSNILIKE